MLVSPKAILERAQKGKYAVGAFNVTNLEVLQGIVRAAVAQRAPIILQASEGAVEYMGMDYIVAMCGIAAKQANVPVAIHLDHGQDLALIREAIRSGFTSVMFDGSHLPYAENIRKTAQVVRLAHARGVYVEAELGAIPGTEDHISTRERDAAFTVPEQALDFVTRTGCDALAISIGTTHGAVKNLGKARLDIPRLKRIRALLPNTPLVLHGASSVSKELVQETRTHCKHFQDCERLEGANGIPDEQVKKAIKNGICKINTDTDLRIAFTASVRETLIEQKKVFDPRKLLGPARDKVQETVEKRIAVFGSRGKHR
ncbi:MAG: class II fructose-1,6-bisphosphate aldolase [Candidatus Uhrbacteria bacterium]